MLKEKERKGYSQMKEGNVRSIFKREKKQEQISVWKMRKRVKGRTKEENVVGGDEKVKREGQRKKLGK